MKDSTIMIIIGALAIAATPFPIFSILRGSVVKPPKEVTNEITPVPQRLLKPHHWRHLISGTIVFLAGICADIVIMDIRHDRAHTIRWQMGDVQKNYHYTTQPIPPLNVRVELGLSDDGSFVWRMPHQ